MPIGKIGKLFLAASFAGATVGGWNMLRDTATAPCEWEEVRDNQKTAALLGGEFVLYHNPQQGPGAWSWGEFKMPGSATPEDMAATLAASGYEKYWNPNHEGVNFRKEIAGRWYHYIVHNDATLEYHWEKSKPGSVGHALDFWQNHHRPPGCNGP